MKHLEDSNKDALEEAEMEAELKLELHGMRRQSTASLGGAIGLEGAAIKMETLSHEQVSSVHSFIILLYIKPQYSLKYYTKEPPPHIFNRYYQNQN